MTAFLVPAALLLALGLRPPVRSGAAAAGAGQLVVVAGLPGSGKTTLVRRLFGPDADSTPGVRVLDAEQVAARLRRGAPRVPYPVLRPVAHIWHRARVLRALAGGAPVVVLPDPWTRPLWRRAVERAARRSGRPLRLVLVDVPAGQARAGQDARRRTVPARRMARHTARWAGVRQEPAALVVDRAGADRLTAAELLGPAAPVPAGVPATRWSA
ncbi:AAA family ATPase [Blastococcus sp. SYSU D00820]